MNLHTALGPGAEFDRIRGIWRALGALAAGGGDDCAIVQLGGERLALSCDLAIQDTHFHLGWLDPRELGWRAAAAALSDLAAVAAEPAGVLASVGVSAEQPDDYVVDVMTGVGEAAESVGAVVWGGDLVRSDRLVIDLFVVGRLTEAPVLRRGAAVGDELWVTGRLGGPFAAVSRWNARQEPDAAARDRFAHPVPRVWEAAWLRDRGARAMIDVSDGLLADAGHLAAASGVGWSIEIELVPLHGAVEVPEEALVSGEEYELLVVFPADSGAAGAVGAGTRAARSAEFERQFGLPLTRIGVASSEGGVRVTRRGAPLPLPRPFAHF